MNITISTHTTNITISTHTTNITITTHTTNITISTHTTNITISTHNKYHNFYTHNTKCHNFYTHNTKCQIPLCCLLNISFTCRPKQNVLGISWGTQSNPVCGTTYHIVAQNWVRLHCEATDPTWSNIMLRQAVLCNACTDQHSGFPKANF